MKNGKVVIGLIQMSVEKDREPMLKKALANVEEAIKAGARIICLPELFRTRYFPRHIGTDAFHCAETVPGESTHFFSRIAKEHQVVIIVPLYEKAGFSLLGPSVVEHGADPWFELQHTLQQQPEGAA